MILKSIIKGIAATAALLGLYFTVLILLSGRVFAFNQFSQSWYWIMSLAFGFGVQVALFSYSRARHRGSMKAGVVAASGTTSTLAMISCCAHYLVNILPIIGISGLAMLIGQYQREIFLVSLLFNLAGLGYMIKKLLRDRLLYAKY